MPDIYILFVASLFTWRLSSMIVREDGPGDMFVKLRKLAGVQWDDISQEFGTTSLSRGILCLWCVSVWIGFVASIATLICEGSQGLPYFVLFWFAVSALAILFDKMVL